MGDQNEALAARRERYRRLGVWEWFKGRRGWLKEQGVEGRDANRWAEIEVEALLGGEVLPDREVTVELPIPESDEDAGRVIVRLPVAGEVAGSEPAEENLKECRDTREILWYVFDNLENERARLKEAPSSGAWSLLKRVRESVDLKDDFYKLFFTKLLPSKGVGEAAVNDGVMDDPGCADLEAVLAGLESSGEGAEGAEGESEVAAGPAEAV